MDLVKTVQFRVYMPSPLPTLDSLPEITAIHDCITRVCTSLTGLRDVRIFHSAKYCPKGLSEQDYMRMGQQELQGFNVPRNIRKVTIDAPRVQPEFVAKLKQVMMGPEPPKPSFPFLKLPAELRNAVYHILLQQTKGDALSIFAVSKQLRNEATYVLYSTTGFECDLSSRSRFKDGPESFLLWDTSRFMSRRASASYISNIKHITFHLDVQSSGKRQGKLGRFEINVARARERVNELCSLLTSLREVKIYFWNSNSYNEVDDDRLMVKYLTRGQLALEPLKLFRNLRLVEFVAGDYILQPEYMEELKRVMMGP
ncbi:MAG: hypothetical protein M1836_002520 [Candelina mexicana]|nr:MAG: hypothetical protein M1836_002520 [Candelina mexicana]